MNSEQLKVCHQARRLDWIYWKRLVAVYTSNVGDSSSLAVILGAKSLDDLVSRLQTVNTVTTQNSTLVREVMTYQRAIVHHRKFLRTANRSAKRLVREAAAAHRSIEAKLAAEQRLYNSVRSEIAQLQASQLASQRAALRQARMGDVASQLTSGYVGNLPPERYGASVGIAERYLGTPYVWGGASPSGFDCSGLVMYVYAQLGISLPHYTGSQWSVTQPISQSSAGPGDLVFFAGLGHVGIYIGNNEFIHAPHTGASVEIDSLTGWYSSEYYGATRILG